MHTLALHLEQCMNSLFCNCLRQKILSDYNKPQLLKTACRTR